MPYRRTTDHSKTLVNILAEAKMAKIDINRARTVLTKCGPTAVVYG